MSSVEIVLELVGKYAKEDIFWVTFIQYSGAHDYIFFFADHFYSCHI